MLDEKKRGNDSDDDGNHLPYVGIQASYVTQKSQQPSACDHKQRILKGLPEKTENEQEETSSTGAQPEEQESPAFC